MKLETDAAIQFRPSQAQHAPAKCIDITRCCVSVCVCEDMLLTKFYKCVCLCVAGLPTRLSTSSLVRLVKSSSLSGTSRAQPALTFALQSGLTSCAHTHVHKLHVYVQTHNAKNAPTWRIEALQSSGGWLVPWQRTTTWSPQEQLS